MTVVRFGLYRISTAAHMPVNDTEGERDSLSHLIQAGADIAGGLTGAAVGLLVAGPVGAIAGGAAGPSISHTLQKIGREISARVLGRREEKRVGAALLFAARKIDQNRAAGQQLRTDDFFVEQPDGRSPADEVVEGVLIAVQREHEERKLPFYGNLLANLAFQAGYDRAQSNMLIALAQRLSYQQLCLLALVVHKDSFKMRPSWRNEQRGASPAQVTALQQMMALYHDGLVTDGSNGVWLSLGDAVPRDAQLQWPGVALYNLMELWAIPMSDVQQAAALFS